ncbi:MAG: hypothetical protein LBC85_04760 [Fibromonadaceae bacterium]|jgi:hypothetical protein|nr:hypothetical protein [Fibromonadaceae bacterium]
MSQTFKYALLFLLALSSAFAIEELDIVVLKVQFRHEETNNSLTTGRGTFNSDPRDYKLDPKGERHSDKYWKSKIKFAEDYFNKASGGKVKIGEPRIFPKGDTAVYRLSEYIIDFNRTARRKGERVEAFDSLRVVDYARFVDSVLTHAKNDPDKPLALKPGPAKRVILIAHAGNSRLVDGGTKGSRAADSPGDFFDIYIDSTWGDFWRGFEVSEGDSIRSVIVSSETASQDGLNWGINGTIVSQIGRELGLPYSYDVVKGFPRLGYFDGMDFAGSNAGNGFFPTLPSAWMRRHKGWVSGSDIREIKPGEKASIEICAAAYEFCDSPQIVKIPINGNEYILLENRQRSYRPDGKITVKMDRGVPAEIELHVDSLYSNFLEDGKQKHTGAIEGIDAGDAALPASGIAAWHINDWYVNELLIPYGAINAWNGDTFRDHQFGISLIEADGILALGKEFRSASGESVFYFGSGSDLLPHRRFNSQRSFDTIFSIEPSGYANTASTFGGFSGIKITAKIPPNAQLEKSLNPFTGDSVVNWRALKIPVEIDWVGKYAIPLQEEKWPHTPSLDDFAQTPEIGFFSLDSEGKFKGKSYNMGQEKLLPVYADINRDGFEEAIFLGNNRLYVVDSNGVPLPNFPVLLSNSEPFTHFGAKPVVVDIPKEGPLILIPVNNGLLLAVNKDGKLLRGEFPLAVGTFVYEDTLTREKFPMLLYKHKHTSNDSIFLFAKHRDEIRAFYLRNATLLAKAPPEGSELKDEISEFFIFPNPIRGGRASIRFRILAPAQNAKLELFDITGLKVFTREISNPTHGSNQIEGLNFSNLGTDIYSARLSVKFESGKTVVKWVRVAVIR